MALWILNRKAVAPVLLISSKRKWRNRVAVENHSSRCPQGCGNPGLEVLAPLGQQQGMISQQEFSHGLVTGPSRAGLSWKLWGLTVLKLDPRDEPSTKLHHQECFSWCFVRCYLV
jgi:hypothetical protein